MPADDSIAIVREPRDRLSAVGPQVTEKALPPQKSVLAGRRLPSSNHRFAATRATEGSRTG